MYKLLACLLAVIGFSADAHLPPRAEISGGGGTQQVIAGPVRGKPGRNALPQPAPWFPELTEGNVAPPVVPLVHTTAIFWGNEWQNRLVAGDKIEGIDTWYSGYSGSNYASALSEYSEVGEVLGSQGVDYNGHVMDRWPSPRRLSRKQVFDEVCRLIANGSVVANPDGTSYFPVYSSRKRPSGEACAWHGQGHCTFPTKVVEIQLAAFYRLDSDSECDPEDAETGHSQGLSSLANMSAVALSDMRTDPGFISWYDVFGNEVGDKCAWTFNVPFVTFSNGSIWKLQGLWSNAAYEAGTGYPNAYGAKGCITGQ